MIDIHNISTETINCACCENNHDAKIPVEVMESINAHIMDKTNKSKRQEPRPWHYWICQKQRGQLPEIMADVKKRKRIYKKSGQKFKEKALKIFMNAGYGCFKQPYFEYHDPRVAELTTAFGQYTLKRLAGDKAIYGDTDSVYLTNESDTIVEEATKINVDLEVDKKWKILFLTSNKKQYYGITQQGKLEHKTLTGMKSNHPAYFNEVTTRLISQEFQESFITNPSSALVNVLAYVHFAFELLKTVDTRDLSYSFEASKNLYEYASNGRERKIYQEKIEDLDSVESAQAASQANNVYRYWKVLDGGKSTITTHPEKYHVDFLKYKEELFNCIEPILYAYGISRENLQRLLADRF
jgi:DNA polymerase elongation subunit (family B)